MKFLSLAAILVHIGARVACHKVADGNTMIETSPQPRIAVMIVGVLLEAGLFLS